MKHPQNVAWYKVGGRPNPSPAPLPETKLDKKTIEYWLHARANHLKTTDAAGNPVDTFSKCPPLIATIIRHQHVTQYWTDVGEYKCITLYEDELRVQYLFHGGGKFWLLEQFYRGNQQFRSAIYTDRVKLIAAAKRGDYTVSEVIQLEGE